MALTLFFGEVPEAAVRVLEAQRWLTSAHTVTLIRDLLGHLRVFIQGPTPSNSDKRDRLVARLEHELGDALGDWLAAAQAVRWAAQRGPRSELDKRLIRQIEDVRRPWSPASRTTTFRLYLIDRHISKLGWVGELEHDPPWSLDDVDARRAPAIVVFFSHKGGVGRSTSLVATALNLARRGRRVVAVDLDLEAPGLSTILLDAEPTVGLLDWLLHPRRADIDLPLRAVTDPMILGDAVEAPMGRLDVLPVGGLDASYLQMLARLDLQSGAQADSVAARLRAMFRGLRRERPNADIILVDARAGLHEIGGALLASLCHLVVFVGTTSDQSRFGLETVARTLAMGRRSPSRGPTPLKVVQGLAGQGDNDAAFAESVYRTLCAHYHGDNPPDARPGDVIALPLDERLRGRGSRLSAQDVDALTAAPFVRLADWIDEKFILLRGQPVGGRGPLPGELSGQDGVPEGALDVSTAVLFRQVVEDAAAIVAAQQWLNHCEVTFIRDLAGRLRILIEGPHGARKGDDRLDALEASLRAALGGWLSAHPAVVLSTGVARPTALRKEWLRFVSDHRRPLDSERPAFDAFIVDRHVAKRGWVGELAYEPPWKSREVASREAPAIVVFFSHKGGVGRSTALVATALNLTRRGRRVLAVDLDLEAPGLGTLLLGADPHRGLVDWLVNPAHNPLGLLLRPPADSSWLGEALFPGEQGSLKLLPAGRLDEDYLQMLARIDLQAIHHPQGLRARLGDLFGALRGETGDEADIILVDARAGLHEIGGVLLASLCHLAVFVGTTSAQSRFGLRTVARLLGESARGGDGEGPVPLKIVEGMAGDRAESDVFAAQVQDDLASSSYAPGGSSGFDPAVVRLPWSERLRGRGGLLDDSVVAALTTKPFRTLADWIDERFVHRTPELVPPT